MDKPFETLYEDADLLVVSKPAGLVCHPTKPDGRASLLSHARRHLGASAQPHLVNRLDRETSGVVLIAKTAAAAGELGRVFARRDVRKEYLAIVHGHLEPDAGVIDAPLGRDETSSVAIKDCVRPDGAPAQTEFVVVRRFLHPAAANVRPVAAIVRGRTDPAPALPTPANSTSAPPFTLLHLQPRTGRKHQLRIHLAHFGHPIVGDKLYGGDETLYLAFVRNRLTDAQRQRLLLPYQALHASAVSFAWRDRAWHFCAQPERWFAAFCGGLI